MMEAGKYYVGDLCYVMHDKWDEFCDKTIVGNDVLDGEFELASGVKVASYCTKYGDGAYSDGEGRVYGVDAGLIGCIKVDDISPEELKNLGDGHVVEFDAPFATTVTPDGVIIFGSVEIPTGDSDEEEDDDYYEEESDDDD